MSRNEPDLDAIQALHVWHPEPRCHSHHVLMRVETRDALVGRVRDLEAELLKVRRDAFEKFDDAVEAEVAKALAEGTDDV